MASTLTILALTSFALTTVLLSAGQVEIPDENVVVWCSVNKEEQLKCEKLSEAVERDMVFFRDAAMRLQCHEAFNKDECMSLLDDGKVHLTSLDPGEVFIGGRYHSLIPIMQEVYDGEFGEGNRRNSTRSEMEYYAVAVVKRGTLSDVRNLRDLRGKRACFGGVGTHAGWVIPVYTLMKEGGMEIIDCNNHVKSTINFFGPSCAVNSLVDKYNPIGDNSDKLCSLCIGQIPGGKCTSADPYAGFEGAFRCLVEAGEIAFLKHTTVAEMTTSKFDFVSKRKSDFELLCRDGTRRSVDEYKSCNWGRVPSHAVVTTSAQSSETRKRYQKFLHKAVELYGAPSNRSQNYQFEAFNLFESAPKYGMHHNLMFQDTTKELVALDESHQTYAGYLGPSLNVILGVRRCTVNRMTLCITSDQELEKCHRMKIALKAQILKPEMSCYRAYSQINCMQAIRNGDADVAVFDAGDVYTAGLQYDLIPFIAEVYNLGGPEYYVVAVSGQDDPSTELTYLKGKSTCHTGIYTAAGWVIPLAYLISNGWIRSYGCDSIRAAAEYFTKSCVPGALSAEYNPGVPYDNLCDLCHGSSSSYCRRDASEDFYGYTGAFRCLVEGGGEVAFVKHTTVMENTDGKRRDFWARNTLTSDYELLCPTGTRAPVSEYASCNMGKVKANAIVARGGAGYNETEIDAFINLFTYAQQFYGRKYQDEFSFSMFSSPARFSDLIFQDATQQLMVINKTDRNYRSYLGRDFLRARALVDCHAGACGLKMSLFATLLTLLCSVWVGRM